MGQSWTNRVRRMGILCAVNLSLYLNCFGGVDQGEKKVTLNVVEESCVKVFKQIEKQTKMSFFYSTSDIRLPGKVSINVVNAALDEVMGRLLEGTGLEWIYTDNIITIRKKKGLAGEGNGMGSGVDSSGNTITVTGKVTQADGTGIPGATVRIKRTNDGTTSDADGNFTLASTKKNDILLISSIGYETREIPVKGKTILAELNLVINKLDETVIIAYGTTTQRLSTGNISTVKAKDIERQPVNNPLLALQGRVPGLLIAQANGLPGSGITVRIQGQNSIGKGNDPLYVIDGVPYTSQLLPSMGSILGTSGNTFGSQNGNPLSYINTADIESIDILKDADATAIYGSRAANGAILITTKKGKASQMKVDINAQTGWGQAARKLKLLNTQQYLEMRHEAFGNDGAIPGIYDYDINGTWDTTRYTDWQKALIGGTAQFNNVQVNISGGNSITQYLVGTGYHRETSVFPDDFSDQKWSLHYNINSTSLNQKLKLQLSGNYLADNNRLPYTDLTSEAILKAPNAPSIYNADGSLNWAPNAAGASTWINPLSYLYNKFKRKTYNLINNAVLSYQILPGLEIKSSFGYTNSEAKEVITTPLLSTPPEYRPYTLRSANYGNTTTTSWIIEPQVSFKKEIGGGNLDLLIGTTIQKNTNNAQTAFGFGYSSDLVLEDIAFAARVSHAPSIASVYKYRALFGRLTYNWQDRYILNLTARRDGSSRFGPANLFHNFGAAGIAWIFSKEAFIEKKLPFLSFGKLRASYGTTGNDQIGEYEFLNLYVVPLGIGSAYQNATGLLPNRHTNPNLQWEESRKLQFGLDLGVLKDRILFGVNYAYNRSSNQLLPYALPIITGFTSVTRNFPAIVQNTSIEFSLNTINVRTKNFNWNSNINLTIPRNKLIDFPNLAFSSYADLLIIGQPIGITKVFHLMDVNTETGIYEFADSKGNPTYTPNYSTDRTTIVNTNPKFYGGIQNSFSYKGFQLDILFQFVKQIGPNYLLGNLPGYIGTNQPLSVLRRWQKSGDRASIQKYDQDLHLIEQFYAASTSDVAYSDASFMRLKNLSLSWEIPTTWKHKLHLQNCRVYTQGQNLFTITRYEGLDPENQTVGSLPPLRVLTVGLQVTL